MSELILCSGVDADRRLTRNRALHKAGFQVVTASTVVEALRVFLYARPSLILIGQKSEISPKACARLKTKSDNADMPVIAICSPESSKRWACQADLCLPETITPAALIAVLRMLLRVQAVERGYLRVQSAATADFGSGVDRPASHSQIRLDELEREKDLLIQQNRHLCEFITSITHEIRSSLCSVIVVSSWILGEYSEQMDASGREYLGLLKESVERMCKVVERAGQQVGMLKPG